MSAPKSDDTAFLNLFQNSTLTLTDGLALTEEAGQRLEQLLDATLAHTLAALPRGESLELVNREEAIGQRLPFVRLQVGSGVLTLPAYAFRLLSFQEVAARLAAEAEAFELFLMQQGTLNWSQYRRALWIWTRVDAETILAFRRWLPRYYASAEHESKLQAVALYVRLAHADGVLSTPEQDAILDAIDKPLPKRKRNKR